MSVLAGLVWLAWPHPPASAMDVLDAYAALEQSPVPVKVVGWIVPQDTRVQLLSDGYIVTLHAARLGDLTISGRRDALPDTPSALAWREQDVVYTVQTTADPGLVQARILSLADARKQLTGGQLDTPILYLWYLPAFVVFGVWASSHLPFDLRRR